MRAVVVREPGTLGVEEVPDLAYEKDDFQAKERARPGAPNAR